jgi:short-subunit dehydrogenase
VPDHLDPEVYGPWAVIAGGSEGVGAAFASLLADAGINLVLLARKPEPLEETAAAALAKGVQVRTLSVDLTSPLALIGIRAVTDGLEVGLLVYNAGANSYGHEFVSGDLEQFQKVIDLNIHAPLALVHHFGAALKQRRKGGILLVGSLAGYLGAERISVYAGVKAFSRVFAEGLWLEMRQYDVQVLELILGVTRTPAMARAGLNLDLPGLNVAEPHAVAQEGLLALTTGEPVHVAAGNDELIAQRQGPDRPTLLVKSAAAAKRLLPRPRRDPGRGDSAARRCRESDRDRQPGCAQPLGAGGGNR